MLKALDKKIKTLSFKIEQKKEKGFLISELIISGAPKELINERILHLTDFHLGPSTSIEHLKKAIEVSNGLNPSAAVFTGDFIQLTHSGLHHNLSHKTAKNLSTLLKTGRVVREKSILLAELFSSLKTKHGIFSTLGNHDYEEGVHCIKRQLGKSLTWINNENKLVANFLNVAGVDDLKEGQPDIKRASSGLKKENFNLLLSHNPDIVLEESSPLLNQFDLILCGHTHGGQIRLPKLPIPLTQTKQRDFICGFKKLRDGKQVSIETALKDSHTGIYVNQGIGYGGIPLRVYCPPEILIISFSVTTA